jgi:hypothetical protein
MVNNFGVNDSVDIEFSSFKHFCFESGIFDYANIYQVFRLFFSFADYQISYICSTVLHACSIQLIIF